MSWEDQGRQYHGWFGDGTGGGVDGAAGVIAGVGGLLPEGLRGGFEGFVAGVGGAGLERAVGIWAGASGLEAGVFRSLVVGERVGAGMAGALQAVGRAVADGDGAAASAALAGAVAGEGAGGWRYSLAFAAAMAAYSEREGLTASSDTSTRNATAGEAMIQRVGLTCEGAGPTRQLCKTYGATPQYTDEGRNFCADCALKFFKLQEMRARDRTNFLSNFLIEE